VSLPQSGHSILGDLSKVAAADAGITWLQEHLPVVAPAAG
jgi:hypothetical protein